MEMHSGYNGCEDHVAHAIMNVLLDHTTSTLKQCMMFMSDKAQDALLGQLFCYKEMLQKARVKDEPDKGE